MSGCLQFLSLFRKGGIFLLFLAACAGFALADDVLTVDFPIQAPAKKLSEHLESPPRQVASPDGTGYAEFSLLPVKDGQDLLVTVVFQEKDGKGPAVFWMNQGASQVNIAGNLADGITGFNQRTILIPREVSSSPGKLILQGDQSKILRVRLDWVPLRRVFAAADQRPVAFIINDRFLQNTDLSGERALSPPDVWFDRVLEASLQEKPESLSENVEFIIPIEDAISQAVLNLKLLGLPLDRSMEVWINGVRIGQLQPGIPALTDAGYLKDQSGKAVYAGWRSGSLYVPADVLQVGDNSIMLVAPGGEAFVRDAALQLRASAEETVAVTGDSIADQL